MSTWYFLENADIPSGTKFPCRLPDRSSHIEDEERFLGVLRAFPGVELEPNGPPEAEEWMLSKGDEHFGELSLSRRPVSGGFVNPFELMKQGMGMGLEALEAFWKLKKQGALTGLSIRAHPTLVLSLFEHLKPATFRDLLRGQGDG